MSVNTVVTLERGTPQKKADGLVRRRDKKNGSKKLIPRNKTKQNMKLLLWSTLVLMRLTC